MKKLMAVILLVFLAGTGIWAGGAQTQEPEKDPLWTETTQEIKPFMTYDPVIEMSFFKAADTMFGYTEAQTPSDNDTYTMIREIVGIQPIR